MYSRFQYISFDISMQILLLYDMMPESIDLYTGQFENYSLKLLICPKHAIISPLHSYVCHQIEPKKQDNGSSAFSHYPAFFADSEAVCSFGFFSQPVSSCSISSQCLNIIHF